MTPVGIITLLRQGDEAISHSQRGDCFAPYTEVDLTAPLSCGIIRASEDGCEVHGGRWM